MLYFILVSLTNYKAYNLTSGEASLEESTVSLTYFQIENMIGFMGCSLLGAAFFDHWLIALIYFSLIFMATQGSMMYWTLKFIEVEKGQIIKMVTINLAFCVFTAIMVYIIRYLFLEQHELKALLDKTQ